MLKSSTHSICSCNCKFKSTVKASSERESIESLYPNNLPVNNYWEEITYTENEFENSILWGTKWVNLPSNTITYTVNQGNASSMYVPGVGSVPLIDISQNIRDAVDTIMNDLTKFTNLSVENVGNDIDDAIISFNFLDADNFDWSFLGIAMPPANTNSEYYEEESQYTSLTDSFWAAGNTYLAYKVADKDSYNKGGFWYDVMLHELGHSLGLAHPHDNGGNSTIMAGVSSYLDFGTHNSNMQPISTMSYNDTNSPILDYTRNGYTSGYMGTYGPLDMKALQYMYGVNPDFNSGDTVYLFPNSTTTQYWTCIYDTGGTNTIDATDAGVDTTINIGNSSLENSTQYAGVKFSYDSFGGFTIASGSTKIHNVIGSSNDDNITGNEVNNEITLNNGGNDVVDGKAGMDTVYMTNISYSDITYHMNTTTGVITVTNNLNSDTINLVNIEKIVFSDKEMLITSEDIIETGYVNVDHMPRTVTLSKTFNDPVVVCGDPTIYGRDPCCVRITNITNKSFSLFLQESVNLDQWHVLERVSYMVGERGYWSINGTDKQVAFGSFSSNRLASTSGFNMITHHVPFIERPVVMSQVASYNEPQLVVTRTRNINNNSFECTMQESEAADQLHAVERIDWCAISPGHYSFSGKKFQCGTISGVNHEPTTVTLTDDYFTSQPRVLTKCSSFIGPDTANTRITQHITFTVRIHEETTQDKEMLHAHEDVDFIAIE